MRERLQFAEEMRKDVGNEDQYQVAFGRDYEGPHGFKPALILPAACQLRDWLALGRVPQPQTVNVRHGL